MINIVMLTRDRPKLFAQCILSLVQSTKSAFNLTVVDDASAIGAERSMEQLILQVKDAPGGNGTRVETILPANV